jgi:hypothetical protein
VEILFLEVEASFFPLPGLDNAGDRWGVINFDLRLSPFQGLRFESFSVVDPNLWAFRRWDAGLTFDAVRGISVTLGTSNVPGSLHATTARATVKFNERWTFIAEGMYDFENGQEVYARFTLRRILHRWVLDLGVNVDRSRDNVEFFFSFLPLVAVPEAW